MATQTKAKFTPGPWTVNGNTPEVMGPTGPPVVSWTGFDDSFRDRREHLANARLIASAPELLEACRLLIKTQAEDRFAIPRFILEKTNAAIAKATAD